MLPIGNGFNACGPDPARSGCPWLPDRADPAADPA
jgi:hypothetical protein